MLKKAQIDCFKFNSYFSFFCSFFRFAIGNVEILHDLKWGNICDDEWDQDEGQVICRQLGFIGFEKITHSGYFGVARSKQKKREKEKEMKRENPIELQQTILHAYHVCVCV